MRSRQRGFRVRAAALAVLVSLGGASTVRAQTATGSGDLRSVLEPGRTVWMTDARGREEKVRIVDWTDPRTVTVSAGEDVRPLDTGGIRRVRARVHDSVLNGALIGAGVMITIGLGMCGLTEPWENCRDDVGAITQVGAIGAGIGIGIDALFRGRRTVYEARPGAARLYAAPIVTGQARGVQLSIAF